METYAGFDCLGAPLKAESGCQQEGDSTSSLTACEAFPDGYAISFQSFNNSVCNAFNFQGYPDFFAMTFCYVTSEPEEMSYRFDPAGANGTKLQLFPNTNCTGISFANQTYEFGSCEPNLLTFFFGSKDKGIKIHKGLPPKVKSSASSRNAISNAIMVIIMLFVVILCVSSGVHIAQLI